MSLRSATMLFAATCLLGCSSKTDQPEGASPNPKPNSETARIKQIEGAPKLTDGMLQEFEEKHKCKLPDDYRRFLLQHNGGFPSPDCVTFNEAERKTATDVFCFHCLGDERPAVSLEWHLKAFAERLPKDTLPIGHDSCGNLWLLNVGRDHRGAIAFWDHGSFDNFDETDFDVWPLVANGFQEFIGKLHEYHPLPEDNALLSRYALVQKAIEGVSQTSEFDKHSMLDAAWHCNYKNGNVEMQGVHYVTHAVATHTDGYSDLRAAKGFIKSGPRRLPQ